jgi:GH35 family endo-1,4-beta-xylanase
MLAREFDVLTPERSMKFERVQPLRGDFTFAEADTVVNFAEAHDQRVRGHALLWHQMIPDWIRDARFSRDEWKSVFRDHIHTVVGQYRGRVICWDVVNEAVSDDAGMRGTLWHTAMGEEYIDWAFHCAHEADPGVPLFYNDFGTDDLGPKSNAVYALLKRLLERGVPIHGVGLQMHLTQQWFPPVHEIAENIRRLADLGLRVHITEMDVRFRRPMTPGKLARQATAYRMALQVSLEAAACDVFTVWGYTDRYSWVPSHFRGWGAALICDQKLRPKPAYRALAAELQDGPER